MKIKLRYSDHFYRKNGSLVSCGSLLCKRQECARDAVRQRELAYRGANYGQQLKRLTVTHFKDDEHIDRDISRVLKALRVLDPALEGVFAVEPHAAHDLHFHGDLRTSLTTDEIASAVESLVEAGKLAATEWTSVDVRSERDAATAAS